MTAYHSQQESCSYSGDCQGAKTRELGSRLFSEWVDHRTLNAVPVDCAAAVAEEACLVSEI